MTGCRLRSCTLYQKYRVVLVFFGNQLLNQGQRGREERLARYRLHDGVPLCLIGRINGDEGGIPLLSANLKQAESATSGEELSGTSRNP